MSKKKSKGKVGPIGKYNDWRTPERLLQLEAWARDGLSNEQICNNMGIVSSTFYEWQNKYPEIREAIKKGKEVVDIEVENALLKRALGYDIVEYKEVEEVKGDYRTTKKEKVKKHMSGDVAAQIFWLKNRKPDQWKDRRETEVMTKSEETVADVLLGVVRGDQEE